MRNVRSAVREDGGGGGLASRPFARQAVAILTSSLHRRSTSLIFYIGRAFHITSDSSNHAEHCLRRGQHERPARGNQRQGPVQPRCARCHNSAQAGKPLNAAPVVLAWPGVCSRKRLRLCAQFKSIKPVGDRVFVKVEEADVRTVGGVLLPSSAQNKPTAGAVVAMGDADTVKVRLAACGLQCAHH